MRRAIRMFLAEQNTISLQEKLRAAAGAFFGILITGLTGSLALNLDSALPILIAPMGASAVLLFAVPASPLAQPRSILGGNVLSALIGVTVGIFVHDPVLSSALAIGLAIPAMMFLRCLHPPSGAIALSAVLGGPAVHAMGYGFVLWPVLGNSLAILLVALIFNNLTGRPYPHTVKPAPAGHKTSDPAPAQRIGFSSEDLDDVLKDYDQVLDIERDDLEDILRRTELRSYRRRATDLTCADVMSRDVISVSPDNTLQDVQKLLHEHHLKALPVIDDKADVVGIVTQTDLLDKPAWSSAKPVTGLRRRLQLLLKGSTAPDGTVSDIMTAPVRTVGPETLLADAILIFAEEGLHHIPVVEGGKRLVGILSQSDVLVAMLADHPVSA
ncbi:HPP family protein [Neorhizobium alkalisoli]|uniref:CBS domain-containing membrane protein n=1 Tax=Neorhizobium alkalisoli TaxID=528178 RepID=A0A561QV39_9HYPH|nr:HPP family protein [Neorhizobium alkalisoli]TWF54176.1 CBS domain-containing membrane protein [Neorhizobium alkalisoli]